MKSVRYQLNNRLRSEVYSKHLGVDLATYRIVRELLYVRLTDTKLRDRLLERLMA